MSKYLDGEGWEDESETDNVKLDDLPPLQKAAWLERHNRALMITGLMNRLGELMKIDLDRKAPLEQKARARQEHKEVSAQIRRLKDLPNPAHEALMASLNPSSTTSPSDKA